jgi:hypothetical protein
MYECFHPTGKLKDNYKRCVELGNYFIKSKQQYIILTNPLQLKMRFASLKETKRITTTFVWCLLIKHQPQLLESKNNFQVSLP